MNKTKLRKYIKAMHAAGVSPAALAAELDVRPRFVYRALGWKRQVIYNPQTMRREMVWGPLSPL